jgi:hypothetical protein
MKADVPKSGEAGKLEIVATSDEMTATKLALRSSKAYIFGVGIFLYVWYLSINLAGQTAVAFRLVGHPAMERTDLLTSLSVFAFPLLGCAVFLGTIFQWVRSMMSGSEVLRCNRDFVEISTMRMGRVRRRIHFAISQVREFEFAREATKRKGHGMLRFKALGKPVTCFKGVKAAEARTILLEMSRFGVDVVGDPQR